MGGRPGKLGFCMMQVGGRIGAGGRTQKGRLRQLFSRSAVRKMTPSVSGLEERIKLFDEADQGWDQELEVRSGGWGIKLDVEGA